MNNEPVALTQGDILGILQDAHSVSLGQPIWNSTEEYNKLKAIIESAIRYTHPVKEQELLVEIETLKEVNAKQVDYIAEQKSAYEKLWSEHMELFWKHEKDTDLTNE